MGARRDESLNRRYMDFASREDIIGKAALIYWSHDTAPEYLRAPGMSLSYIFDLALSAVSKMRWERSPLRARSAYQERRALPR